MADRQVREGAEGYTQFDNPQSPYNKPFGLVGRFFKKFFSREVEDYEDGQYSKRISTARLGTLLPTTRWLRVKSLTCSIRQTWSATFGTSLEMW
jgi:hypothetical protein